MADGLLGNLIALVPPSLVPVPAAVPTAREQWISEVALDLQRTSAGPDSVSVSVAVHLGVEWVDRVTEILGRVGSAGEQLAIALATNRDARRWTTPDSGEWEPQHATMAVRAQAEMSAMWALGAAHGLANALVRMLWLNEDARDVLDKARPQAGGFRPFSEEPTAWVSFEPDVMRVARKSAAASGSPAAIDASNALSALLGDMRWARFLELRNVGFHRWRPQSVDGGTPKRSSVIVSGTSRSITVRSGPSNFPPDVDSVLKVTESGLDLFANAAKVFDSKIQPAVNELTGKTIFRV